MLTKWLTGLSAVLVLLMTLAAPAVAGNRNSFGVNYFMNKHKAKVQFTYRMGENLNGVPGADEDEAIVRFQFVF